MNLDYNERESLEPKDLTFSNIAYCKRKVKKKIMLIIGINENQ